MNLRNYSIYFFIPLCLLPIAITVYTIHSLFSLSSSVLIAIVSIISMGMFLLWCSANIQLAKQKKKTKTAEGLLKNKEAEYSSLIENMGGVLYRCDIQGYFTWLSKKCFELTGYTEVELKGKHFTELIVPEWRHQVEEFYFNQNSYRIPETVFRFPIYSKDGYKKWVEQTVVFVYEGPRCLGYQAMVKDVTDTKLAEDLLQESNKNLSKEQHNFQIPRYSQSANFTEHRKIR